MGQSFKLKLCFCYCGCGRSWKQLNPPPENERFATIAHRKFSSLDAWLSQMHGIEAALAKKTKGRPRKY